MKTFVVLATCAIAVSAALAQAPAGVVQRPSAETNSIAAGGAPAAKSEMKTEMKKGMETGMPMSASGKGMGMGMAGMMNMKDMDTNGDGMISKQEWQAHHNRMWNMMHAKDGKAGKIPVADVEAMLKGGPN
jgi:hypothetical protein